MCGKVVNDLICPNEIKVPYDACFMPPLLLGGPYTQGAPHDFSELEHVPEFIRPSYHPCIVVSRSLNRCPRLDSASRHWCHGTVPVLTVGTEAESVLPVTRLTESRAVEPLAVVPT